jgi:DNA helicase-4
MKLESSKVYDLIFSLGRASSVRLTKEGISYKKHLIRRNVSYVDIVRMPLIRNWHIVRTLRIATKNDEIVVAGLRDREALLRFCFLLKQRMREAKLGPMFLFCGEIDAALADYYQTNATQRRYFKASEAKRWAGKHTGLLTKLKSFKKAPFYGHLPTAKRRRVDWLEALSKKPDIYRKEANEDFVNYAEYTYQRYFDEVEAKPLTERQRRACVVDEDNNLVLAGAGSGKTSVIVAKAGFVEQMGWAKANEILVLAYGRKASHETQERIDNRLGQDSQIKASTFHALGLRIIGEVEGERPGVFTPLESSEGLIEYIHEQVARHSKQDADYRSDLLTYFSDFLYPLKDAFEFKTLGEYYEHMAQHDPQTLDGNKVKSQEELRIGNFFYLNRIQYDYEAPFHAHLATAERRQYKPDFRLRERLYLEHYGINERGETPPFMNEKQSKDYKEAIHWKRAVHGAHNSGVIETYSGELRTTDWKTNLIALLKGLDIGTESMDAETALGVLNEKETYNRLDRLMASFLELQKMKDVAPAELLDLSRADPEVNEWLKSCGLGEAGTKRFAAFLRIYLPVFNDYQEEIKERSKIDFSDMINKAVGYIESGAFKSPWKYILVDEFQDISTGRAKLVKALIKGRSDSTLFCVGDDWQSIYRFAGADTRYVRHFEQQFGTSERTDLDMTFRFNSSISEVATMFINKNPEQLQKNIEAFEQTQARRVSLVMFDRSQADAALYYCLDTIEEETEGKDGNASVFLLGRFRHTKPAGMKQIQERYPNLQIAFHTMHASKGSEADYAVLLGIEGGRFGVPSDIETDPIMELLMPQDESFKDAEERRLFYVALTRAKRHAFVLGNWNMPSRFTKELLLEQEQYGILAVDSGGNPLPPSELITCKKCETGAMVRRSNSQDGSVFFSCSNYPYCDEKLHCCLECEEGCLVLNGIRWQCSKCSHTEERCPGPKCRDGRLIPKDGPYGPFWGCTNYSRKYEAISCTYKRKRVVPVVPEEEQPEIKIKSPKSEPLAINEIPIKELRQLALDIGNDRKNGDMLVELFRHPDYEVRRRACSAASKLKDESIVAKIGPCISAPEPQIRQYALRAILKSKCSSLMGEVKAQGEVEDTAYNANLIAKILEVT